MHLSITVFLSLYVINEIKFWLVIDEVTPCKLYRARNAFKSICDLGTETHSFTMECISNKSLHSHQLSHFGKERKNKSKMKFIHHLSLNLFFFFSFYCFAFFRLIEIYGLNYLGNFDYACALLALCQMELTVLMKTACGSFIYLSNGTENDCKTLLHNRFTNAISALKSNIAKYELR